MSFRYIKASHLDASAAVKLVLQERGSEELRSYLANRASFYITSVCLAKALGVFKRKRLGDELSEKQYLATCYVLLGYLRSPLGYVWTRLNSAASILLPKQRRSHVGTSSICRTRFSWSV